MSFRDSREELTMVKPVAGCSSALLTEALNGESEEEGQVQRPWRTRSILSDFEWGNYVNINLIGI
jgi:hypothetical protein